MNTIVTKFGGSSLADSIHFKKVKNIFIFIKKAINYIYNLWLFILCS